MTAELVSNSAPSIEPVPTQAIPILAPPPSAAPVTSIVKPEKGILKKTVSVATPATTTVLVKPEPESTYAFASLSPPAMDMSASGISGAVMEVETNGVPVDYPTAPFSATNTNNPGDEDKEFVVFDSSTFVTRAKFDGRGKIVAQLEETIGKYQCAIIVLCVVFVAVLILLKTFC